MTNDFVAIVFNDNYNNLFSDVQQLLNQKWFDNPFTTCRGKELNHHIFSVEGYIPLVEFEVRDAYIEEFCHKVVSMFPDHNVWIQCMLIQEFTQYNDEVKSESISVYEFRNSENVYQMSGVLYSGNNRSFEDINRRNFPELEERCKNMKDNPVVYITEDNMYFYRQLFENDAFYAIDGTIGKDVRSANIYDRLYYLFVREGGITI